MKIVLRAGKVDDAKACGLICYEAFKAIAIQHNFPPDFPSPDFASGLLSSLFFNKDIYSVVAEIDGRVIGSNFLWENSSIAGVGPISVDTTMQDDGIGRQLMEDVLDRARKKRFVGVRLVQASYNNRSLSLYTKLGFDVREPLSVIHGPAIGLEIPGYIVRLANERDLNICNKICLRVYGHDRRQEFLDSIKQGTAIVVEHGGRITGYATLIGFFGHAIGESNEDLKALISAAKTFSEPGFLLPTRNGELFRWCLEKGLRVVQQSTLMSLGLYNEPTGVFLPSILY